MNKILQHILQQKYSINSNEEFRLGRYEACLTDNHLYLLIPVGNMKTEEISDLDQIARHLIHYGDYHVCQFLKSKDGESRFEWRNEHYSIIVSQTITESPLQRIGGELAKFHYYGRLIPFEIEGVNRIGRWKQFWEQRLDQMEKVWNGRILEPPDNEFERLFIESFPYYMGLAENAIQYLIDTEIDDDPIAVDSGTVCHERFSAKTWGDHYILKNPFDWVFDHCTRDLAEWTRELYFKNIKTYEPDMKQFFFEYGAIMPLSSFSWRLLYARLLFPLHFFECVEDYYITSSEQQKLAVGERLNKYLEQTREHEAFLKNFFPLLEVPMRAYRIPQVEWL